MTRFTLRDVFWLTLVAAMGLGWWATYRSAHLWESRAGCALEAFSAVGYKAEWKADGIWGARDRERRRYGVSSFEFKPNGDMRIISD